MEGMVVTSGSHCDFVCHTREWMRSKVRHLDEEIEKRRSSTWTRTSVGPADLLPGLPEELVLTEIWPRLRSYAESVEKNNDTFLGMQRKILCITSLSVINKKWRHLATSSKPWAGVKFIDHTAPFFKSRPHLVMCIQYQQIMRILPPLDAFSVENDIRILNWLEKWAEYDKEERDILLELYPDEQHMSGRLEDWRGMRDSLEDVEDGLGPLIFI